MLAIVSNYSPINKENEESSAKMKDFFFFFLYFIFLALYRGLKVVFHPFFIKYIGTYRRLTTDRQLIHRHITVT